MTDIKPGTWSMITGHAGRGTGKCDKKCYAEKRTISFVHLTEYVTPTGLSYDLRCHPCSIAIEKLKLASIQLTEHRALQTLLPRCQKAELVVSSLVGTCSSKARTLQLSSFYHLPHSLGMFMCVAQNKTNSFQNCSCMQSWVSLQYHMLNTIWLLLYSVPKTQNTTAVRNFRGN